MQVAALYDIHGNLPALEAVLEEVCRREVDVIVVGGDVVPGPMAGEALSRLLSLGQPVRFIRGNCETEVLAAIDGKPLSPMPESARAIIRWTAQHLSSEQSRLFATWPLTTTLDIPGIGTVLFCHGTPRHENEIFTRLTSEDHLLTLFESLGVSVVVCGHTHMQFDRRIGPVRVVNAGSVGMPFGEPGAHWLLLGPTISFQRTLYDLDEASKRIRRTEYPEAEGFAANNVLRRPSEEQMLRAFARMEPREG